MNETNREEEFDLKERLIRALAKRPLEFQAVLYTSPGKGKETIGRLFDLTPEESEAFLAQLFGIIEENFLAAGRDIKDVPVMASVRMILDARKEGVFAGLPQELFIEFLPEIAKTALDECAKVLPEHQAMVVEGVRKELEL